MTTDQDSMAQPGAPIELPWSGIHHLALATHDLDETIHFYQHILGMAVSPIAPSRGGRGRHCMIVVNAEEGHWAGLHFFERSTVRPPSQPATLASVGMSRNPLLHIALHLPNQTMASHLHDRLHGHGVDITEIAELGSFVFSDNNANLLEVVWPKP